MLANALLVILLLGFNTISFNHSFSNYVEQREERRLAQLTESLATVYESQGDWQWVREEPALLIRLVRSSMGKNEVRQPSLTNGNKGPRAAFAEQLRLKDAGGELVYGSRVNEKKVLWLPITGNSAEPIGFIGVELVNRIDAQVDELFLDRLKWQFYLVSIATFVIAGVLAITFSGWIVRPIKKIAAAMRKLSDGDFTASVSAGRNDELGQLAADFNHMSKVLQKAQSDRQQWVSDIAHELRTPVAILQGDIEAAQDGIRKVDDQWLNHMYAHSERLNRLVGDLHQLSQSDAGTLSYRFESLDLARLTEEVVTQFRTSLSQQNIDISVDADRDLMIDGDSARLVQLLTNFAQNTLRYTDSDEASPGRLHISVEAVKEGIRLTWEDSSPGVDSVHLPKLFDRLYRVDDSRSRESGGSGLGLAIARNIVDAHQGSINADHSTLGGLKITVILPPSKETDS